jgi:hypothetical protein
MDVSGHRHRRIKRSRQCFCIVYNKDPLLVLEPSVGEGQVHEGSLPWELSQPNGPWLRTMESPGICTCPSPMKKLKSTSQCFYVNIPQHYKSILVWHPYSRLGGGGLTCFWVPSTHKGTNEVRLQGKAQCLLTKAWFMNVTLLLDSKHVQKFTS